LVFFSMESYGFSKQAAFPFNETVERVKHIFARAGFGALSDIDVQAKFREKLGREFPKYRMLGMCSPSRAFAALSADPEIGLLLPCNVVVYERGGVVTVSAIRPKALFSVVEKEDVRLIAEEVEEIIRGVMDEL